MSDRRKSLSARAERRVNIARRTDALTRDALTELFSWVNENQYTSSCATLREKVLAGIAQIKAAQQVKTVSSPPYVTPQGSDSATSHLPTFHFDPSKLGGQ